MNRTFLIFLMVGSAMMIAVLGQYKPHTQLNYTPWDIQIQDNGASRVFGLTLGKSNIQEANQIFASFADTRLLIDESNQPVLVAHYNELVMDGIVADLELYYQLEPAVLEQLHKDLVAIENSQRQQTYKLPADTEMDYLSTPIARIVYKPAIQYGEELITQRFGAPQQTVKVDDQQRHWLYPDSGLTISLFDGQQAEEFEYRPLKQPQS
ncbi:MAG TPA: hypothetical protein VIQ81_01990 [Gammaproteobacteria bacterium]